MKALTHENNVGTAFEEIHAGRRLVLEYACSPHSMLQVAVLDSPDASGNEFDPSCAAMLVPCGKEPDWMYSSEGGQWQLLASAGVTRLILLSRICETHVRAAHHKMETNSISEHIGMLGEKRKVIPEELGSHVHSIALEKEPTELGQAFLQSQKKMHVEDTGREDVQERVTQKYKHANFCLENGGEAYDEKRIPPLEVEEQCRLDHVPYREYPPMELTTLDEDHVLKSMLASFVLALAPRISFRAGVPSVPFADYTDNILQKVVVEEADSPLTGLMRVEDVELEIEECEIDHITKQTSSAGLMKEGKSLHCNQGCATKSWRRRLIFRRMPNLIQTEVLLSPIPPSSPRGEGSNNGTTSNRMRQKSSEVEGFSSSQLDETELRQVDHSRLVHKYLPPIVAGFVLVAPYLDSCLNFMARVLSIGVGGGALPIFLHRHFNFHIQAIDLDERVIQLAEKHFGLREDAFFQVSMADGLEVVEGIAVKAIQAGVVDICLKQSWRACVQGSECPLPRPACHHDASISKIVKLPVASHMKECGQGSNVVNSQKNIESGMGQTRTIDQALQTGTFGSPPEQCPKLPKQQSSGSRLIQSETSSASKSLTCSFLEDCGDDPRVQLIILDVDAGDARLSLSSPPLSFLERRFLLSARIALQSGGMLAMNVVPCGEKPYADVINALKAVFAEVYEIALKDDLNRVVFALPTSCSNYPLNSGHTVDQVRKVVGERLIQSIRRVDNIL